MLFYLLLFLVFMVTLEINFKIKINLKYLKKKKIPYGVCFGECKP